MPTAREQGYSEQTLQRGGVRKSQTFRVDAPPSLATTAAGIPNTIDGLPVREVTATRVAQNITDVTITATDSTGASLYPPPPVDITDPNRVVWQTQTVNIENTIPYATSVTQQVINASGETVPYYYWQRNEETVTDDGQIIRLSITRATMTPTDFGLIQDQANNIHTIGGRQYKFLQASTQQVAESAYSVTYEWLSDPGTKQIVGTAPVDGVPADYEGEIIWPGAGIPYLPAPAGSSVAPAGLLRAPFHRLLYVPAVAPIDAGAPDGLPKVLHTIVGTVDPDGWELLPGVAGAI